MSLQFADPMRAISEGYSDTGLRVEGRNGVEWKRKTRSTPIFY